MPPRIIIFAVAVSLPISARCAASCADAPDHASERACWIKASADADARVHAAQVVQRRRIEKWDEDPPFKARTLALFNETALRFARFRRAQCDYEASSAAGGNGAGDMRLSCQLELDNAYVRSIRSQAAWFPPDG